MHPASPAPVVISSQTLRFPDGSLVAMVPMLPVSNFEYAVRTWPVFRFGRYLPSVGCRAIHLGGLVSYGKRLRNKSTHDGEEGDPKTKPVGASSNLLDLLEWVPRRTLAPEPPIFELRNSRAGSDVKHRPTNGWQRCQ